MRRPILLALVWLLGLATPALAQRYRTLPPLHPDLTAFGGLIGPGTSPVVGGAFGFGNSVFRGEIEIAGSPRHGTPTRPSYVGISADFMLQTRSSPRGFQFYGIGGFGLLAETFGSAGGSGESTAKNFGVGIKLKLAGPLRLRVDYRLFVLGDTGDATRGLALHHYPQRVVVGLNLSF